MKNLASRHIKAIKTITEHRTAKLSVNAFKRDAKTRNISFDYRNDLISFLCRGNVHSIVIVSTNYCTRLARKTTKRYLNIDTCNNQI